MAHTEPGEPVVFLQTCDVARMLGCTPANVRALSDRGRLVVAKRTATGMRLYRREDVEAFQAARRENRAALQGRV